MGAGTSPADGIGRCWSGVVSGSQGRARAGLAGGEPTGVAHGRLDARGLPDRAGPQPEFADVSTGPPSCPAPGYPEPTPGQRPRPRRDGLVRPCRTGPGAGRPCGRAPSRAARPTPVIDGLTRPLGRCGPDRGRGGSACSPVAGDQGERRAGDRRSGRAFLIAVFGRLAGAVGPLALLFFSISRWITVLIQSPIRPMGRDWRADYGVFPVFFLKFSTLPAPRPIRSGPLPTVERPAQRRLQHGRPRSRS